MMNKLRLIILLFVIGLITGCANWTPWYQQNYAGLTHVELTGCNEDQGVEGQMYCHVTIYDGKEKTNVNVVVSKNPTTGELRAEYSATNVEAFGGQELRAAVDEAAAATIEKMTPSIIDAVKAAIGTP